MLKAGVSVQNISPKKGVSLAGYPHCPRYNTGVHDDVYATVIYINNGKNDLVLIGMDLLYFGKVYCAELRKKFNKKIITFTTHTHCAPWASELLASEKADGMKVDDDYIAFLMGKLEDGIKEAMNNTFEAEIGSAVGKCGSEFGIGGNRRDIGGTVDDSLNVLAVRDKKKTIRGILVNYALHPTYLHEDVTEVSADYPCYIRRFFKFAYPEAGFAFAQGCSGNQSSRYFRVAQNFEEAARAGTTLGVESKHLIDSMNFKSDIDISLITEEVSLPFKKFLSEEQAEKELKIAEDNYKATEGKDFLTRWNAELKLFGAQSNKNFSRLIKQGYVSPETPNEISIIKIDDLTIVGIQGELFVEYDLAIKELNKNKKTFVFSMTNGTAPGYLYTEEEAKIGGYEVGNSMFSEKAGKVLLDKVKEML